MGRESGRRYVNTSLNVGAPIAQTPVHALETLKRSAGMHALFMVAETGDVFVVCTTSKAGPKTGASPFGPGLIMSCEPVAGPGTRCHMVQDSQECVVGAETGMLDAWSIGTAIVGLMLEFH
jgi:hypothetical protein